MSYLSKFQDYTGCGAIWVIFNMICCQCNWCNEANLDIMRDCKRKREWESLTETNKAKQWHIRLEMLFFSERINLCLPWVIGDDLRRLLSEPPFLKAHAVNEPERSSFSLHCCCWCGRFAAELIQLPCASAALWSVHRGSAFPLSVPECMWKQNKVLLMCF